MSFATPSQIQPQQSSQEDIHPEHIAIIMDGNRRWASAHGMATVKGHEQGVEVLERIMKHCSKRGIKTLTVYTFSTENWKRTKEEVTYLLRLIVRFVRRKKAMLFKEGVRLRTLGELSDFPNVVQKTLKSAMRYLDSNKKSRLTLNVALSYGGRREIVSAVKQMMQDGVSPDQVSEDKIEQYLYTKSQKDPELIIRTGGQLRLSNFLLWQSSYSELYFTNTLWPDFNEQELDRALTEFTARKRNFGA